MIAPAEFTLFATAPRGLEGLLAAELAGLGLRDAADARGGASFRADLAGAYRACLWSRLGNRVLLPLVEFDAADDDALYEGVREVDWSEHIARDGTLAVDFTGIRPAIQHSRFAVQRVKDAIVDQIRERHGERPGVDPRQPDVRINVHMNGERVRVAVDLAGDSLHRRGYREAGTVAPLKENLAAAMLVRADWPELVEAHGAFVDPMCGSATLAIEAAWMAGDVAPGLLRTRFGFHHWRGHDDALWKTLIDEALEREAAGRARIPAIHAFDHEAPAVRIALANVRRAGLEGVVHVERRTLDEAAPPHNARTGLVATNPPYGERLAAQHELLPLYLRLGETLKRNFGGWRALVLNGSGCEIGLAPARTWQLFNGPLECRLERFEVSESSGDRDTPMAEDLFNRVRKNQRQMRKWLEREGITCYRVYDADIPEYALAVDVYGTTEGDWLHVQEYQPPATVDPAQARTRLRAALATLPRALDIAESRMVFKVRKRQRGTEQYTRQSEQGKILEVAEGPCRLAVNLTDYLDTGLFLDHRPMRRWLGENARGRRFLNLFCYTGAATVHAALGGARSSTSIDLSRTYLDWLKRNLALNNADGPAHRVMRADARAWLADCRETFDLIFLDPPSFSNSKKMDSSLDVQRDHPALIREAMARLAPDGVLVFSTNLRRFKLDPALAAEFDFDDRTRMSLPRDFARGSPIHRCWFVRSSRSNSM